MKRKLVGLLGAICLTSVLILSGCGENYQIVNLRKCIQAVNFEKCFGYTQSIKIKNGDFEYESYNLTISFNGQSVKAQEITRTLNPVGSDDAFSEEIVVKYISDGYLIEKQGNKFVKTEEAQMKLSLNIDVYESYFSLFTFEYDENHENYIFNANIDDKSYFKFAEDSNVFNMKMTAYVADEKLDWVQIKYDTPNGSNVTIKTSIFYDTQSFELPI